MSSLSRMLAVLDIFTPDRPVISADEIIGHFGYSRGTAYRYIRQLCNAGLLSHVPGAYVLGPRIVELDYYIREGDPVLRVSQPVMQRIRDEIDCDVLLTSYYEERVIVSHHERSTAKITVSYGRGRVMPLFDGAGSKIILAHLPEPRQKRLYERHKKEISAKGMADTWTQFRNGLEEIRSAGISISIGELDAGNVGIAAPILFDDQRLNLGSIVLVLDDAHYRLLDDQRVANIAAESAAYIERLLEEEGRADALRSEWLGTLVAK